MSHDDSSFRENQSRCELFTPQRCGVNSLALMQNCEALPFLPRTETGNGGPLEFGPAHQLYGEWSSPIAVEMRDAQWSMWDAGREMNAWMHAQKDGSPLAPLYETLARMDINMAQLDEVMIREQLQNGWGWSPDNGWQPGGPNIPGDGSWQPGQNGPGTTNGGDTGSNNGGDNQPPQNNPPETTPSSGLEIDKRFPDRVNNLNSMHYSGDCSQCTISNMVYLATGQKISENQVVNDARAMGYSPETGMDPNGRETLLNKYLAQYGVQAVNKDGQTVNDIAKAVEEGKVVSCCVDPYVLRGQSDTYHGNGHDVLVTGVQKDANGNVTGFLVQDEGVSAKPQLVSLQRMETATNGNNGTWMQYCDVIK